MTSNSWFWVIPDIARISGQGGESVQDNRADRGLRRGLCHAWMNRWRFIHKLLFDVGVTENTPTCCKIHSLGAAGWGKGFVTCFLRVPRAVELTCSCHAAPASRGNFQKTCYKTFYSTCRPRLYICPCGAHPHRLILITLKDNTVHQGSRFADLLPRSDMVLGFGIEDVHSWMSPLWRNVVQLTTEPLNSVAHAFSFWDDVRCGKCKFYLLITAVHFQIKVTSIVFGHLSSDFSPSQHCLPVWIPDPASFIFSLSDKSRLSESPTPA